MSVLYRVINAARPTTAAPAAVATGTTIKTMLQVKPSVQISLIEWGYSFSAAVAVGTIELLETGTVAATVTAYVDADVMPYTGLEPANASSYPLEVGTAASGYTATAEGTITAARQLDHHRITPNPNLPIWRQHPLQHEPGILKANFGRIRVTMTADVNMYCYLIFRVG